jgi:hypothetical protein
MEDTLQDWTQSRLAPNDSGLDETKNWINQFQWKNRKVNLMPLWQFIYQLKVTKTEIKNYKEKNSLDFRVSSLNVNLETLDS